MRGISRKRRHFGSCSDGPLGKNLGECSPAIMLLRFLSLRRVRWFLQVSDEACGDQAGGS
jgi:hypothetical protein